MDVHQRESGDVERLGVLLRMERAAELRDRYLVVVHALSGKQTLWIAGGLGRTRTFVQRWVYGHRDGVIDALKYKPRGGSRPKLPREHEARLKVRIDAGPTTDDTACTLRGMDVQRIVREEFGVDLPLNAASCTLHRLGDSCLAPQPRDEKCDLVAQEEFKTQHAPSFSAPSATLAPGGGKCRVFFMDEDRFGRQCTQTLVWAPRGMRPTAVKQTRRNWLYLYAAIEPSTGASVAVQAPDVNTATFTVLLEMLLDKLGPRHRAVLIIDQTGWHKAWALKVPPNITILYLPPYSPELNAVERLWAHLRSHYLDNQVLEDYEHLFEAGA